MPSLYCKELLKLNRLLSEIGSPYVVVEEILQYPRHRENLAVFEIANRINCDAVCANWDMLENRVKDKKICVLLPGGKHVSKQAIAECDEIVVAESAFTYSLELGIRPLITVSDLDGPELLTSLYDSLSTAIAVHVHGDNFVKVLNVLGRIRGSKTVYTSQVCGYRCVVGPLGFTDGDRAAIIPLLLGAKEVDVIGFDLRVPKGKRFFGANKKAKVGLGYLFIHYYASRLGYVVKGKDRLKIIKL